MELDNKGRKNESLEMKPQDRGCLIARCLIVSSDGVSRQCAETIPETGSIFARQMVRF